jgi:hypothetical protein
VWIEAAGTEIADVARSDLGDLDHEHPTVMTLTKLNTPSTRADSHGD